MKLAAVTCHRGTWRAKSRRPTSSRKAYGGASAPLFGKDNRSSPRPFDPRLILRIAPAVAASAAMDTGVARANPSPISTAYEETLLNSFVFRSGFIMKPVFAKAKRRRARSA